MATEVKKDDSKSQDLFKRRKVPRRTLKKRIGLLVSGEYSLNWAFEIGEGGMLIESSKQLRLDQKIVISFRIPDVVHGVMLAKVVYELPKKGTKTPRYGVQFENIDFEVKRKIRNFVASATVYAAEA